MIAKQNRGSGQSARRSRFGVSEATGSGPSSGALSRTAGPSERMPSQGLREQRLKAAIADSRQQPQAQLFGAHRQPQ